MRPGFPVRGSIQDCACGFQQESRMKFANAAKVHRKSGKSPQVRQHFEATSY